MTSRLTGEANPEVGGSVSVETPILVTSRKGGLKQEGANEVGDSAIHALGLPVLSGGVRTRHPQLHVVQDKEGTRRGVIELPLIVTLNTPDGATELSQHPSEEVRGWGRCQTYKGGEKSRGSERSHPGSVDSTGYQRGLISRRSKGHTG